MFGTIFKTVDTNLEPIVCTSCRQSLFSVSSTSFDSMPPEVFTLAPYHKTVSVVDLFLTTLLSTCIAPCSPLLLQSSALIMPSAANGQVS